MPRHERTVSRAICDRKHGCSKHHLNHLHFQRNRSSWGLLFLALALSSTVMASNDFAAIPFLANGPTCTRIPDRQPLGHGMTPGWMEKSDEHDPRRRFSPTHRQHFTSYLINNLGANYFHTPHTITLHTLFHRPRFYTHAIPILRLPRHRRLPDETLDGMAVNGN